MDEYLKEQPARRRSLVGPLLLALVAFLGGIALMVYAVRQWPAAQAWLGLPTAAAAPAALPAAQIQPSSRAAPATAPAGFPLADAAATDRRIAQVEGRLADIDARARLTAANAERAEAMLIAIAARRAVDEGLPLGYVEGMLRERFGGTEPQAVATIIAAARQPVLLETLKSGLVADEAVLVGRPATRSWWDGFREELGGLIVVRRASALSTRPDERFARATAAVDSGRVGVALAEVARLPGRDGAEAWIGQARRYAAARAALDRIETAALLSPRLPAIDPVAAEPQGVIVTPGVTEVVPEG
ncbi:hypothetical protein ABC347_13080 [Sphingomonas sp. 1P06PA]|uniref:hypothetical protein n=1 Tax=Sphingomonas sp. 1P06PA TaxID=554121 RepID=UPI0039A43841